MQKLNWLDRIIGFFLWRFGNFQFRIKLILDNPPHETVKDKVVYVIGNEDYVKWAYLKCPDGCGDTIMLSLSKNKRPSWRVEQDNLGRVTIYPSIHKQEGCESHFWIKKGYIFWI